MVEVVLGVLVVVRVLLLLACGQEQRAAQVVKRHSANGYYPPKLGTQESPTSSCTDKRDLGMLNYPSASGKPLWPPRL